MNKSSIAIAVFALFGIAASANAQIANPDNDSATFFKWSPASVNDPKPDTIQPKRGDVSPDGMYIYTGGNRGWTHRGHSFDYSLAGGLKHTPDCLPYGQAKPAVGPSVAVTSGPFAEHGV